MVAGRPPSDPAEPSLASRARATLPWLLPAVWTITFVGSLVAAIVAAFVLPSAAPLLLQVLGIVVSGPAVAIVIAFAFGIAFRRQIAGFVERMSEFTLPGGASLRAFQQTAAAEPPPPSAAKGPAKSDEPPAATGPAQRELQEQVRARLREARYWYHRYLSVFLAPVTQAALRWLSVFARDKTVPYAAFTAYVQSLGVTDLAVQANTWNALEQHGLADAHGNMVNITRGGRAFLKYIDGEWRPLELDEPVLD